jgi:hypothetical protein
MNAIATEPADAVREAAGEFPCLRAGGSRIYAGLSADGVLVVRVYPEGDTPVAVFVDEALVAGSEMDWRPVGRHRVPPDPADGE